MPRLRRRKLPDATIARLPQYIRSLAQMENAGIETVHSVDLAAHAGVSAAVVRRDLSYVGSYGTRGVGYPVADLREQVNRSLGLATEHGVVVIGAGRMGQALAGYTGFAERGLRVCGIFDVAPELIGGKAGNPVSGFIDIRPMDELATFVREHKVAIAVLATPADVAASVADALVEAGITSILNLTAVHLCLPESVVVRPVDLATEIQILAVHAAQRRSK